MNFVGDLHTLVTADGNSFHVPDENNRFQVYIGYGAPPIQYITRQSYKQHGATKLDYLLQPRTIFIKLWQKPACSRADYWANRATLHNLLRPNRGGSMTLILEIPGGTKRAITLDPDPGAIFGTSQLDNNSWGIEEDIDFICFDPIWYNPDTPIRSVSADASQNLIFPITFPIQFGPGGTTFTTTIQYAGTWDAYPIITLRGAYTSARIINVTTGISFTMQVPIIDADTRIVTLKPGSLSIVDGLGVNKFGDLSSDSDLVDFSIRPAPEVTSGTNIIQGQIVGADSNTLLTIQYQERYYAI